MSTGAGRLTASRRAAVSPAGPSARMASMPKTAANSTKSGYPKPHGAHCGISQPGRSDWWSEGPPSLAECGLPGCGIERDAKTPKLALPADLDRSMRLLDDA